jgi:hypothetical protein
MKLGTATVLAGGTVGEVRGQVGPITPPAHIPTEVVDIYEKKLPNSQLMTGLHAQVSWPIGRFEPFANVSGMTRLNEQKLAISRWHDLGTANQWNLDDWHYFSRDTLAMYNPRFSNTYQFMAGTKFKIDDKNLIKAGLRFCFNSNQGRFDGLFAGYMRRESLSPRTGVDLYALYVWGEKNIGGRISRTSMRSDENGNVVVDPDRSYSYQGYISGGISHGVELGANFKHSVTDNTNLSVRLAGSRFVTAGGADILELKTTNTVSATVGVEIKLGGQVTPRTPRAPRPSFGAIPCP